MFSMFHQVSGAKTAIVVWAALAIVSGNELSAGEPWRRHVIDHSARGADGVRLGDVNGDSYEDIVTPWEESGLIRVYLNPGPQAVKKPWPAVTVGEVGSPEDAFFFDVDFDRAVDVVSSCEGKTRSMFVHWAPRDRGKLLDSKEWKTEPLPVTAGHQQWMFAESFGEGLFAGGKGSKAAVVRLERPDARRDLAKWRMQTLASVGWVMSLEAMDVDRDHNLDLVVSDRKGPTRGVFWLENPGRERAALADAWRRHDIGGNGEEVMFLTPTDLDRDGETDLVAATRNGKILYFQRVPGKSVAWRTNSIENPFGIKGGKAVHVDDIDRDGRYDLIHTAELGGQRDKPGICWMRYKKSPTEAKWEAHDISGPEGSKFDRVVTRDLDGDGDYDVIACEERDNLGVVWYENPTR